MFIESLLIILAYVIGSISGAILVSRAMGLPDPRTQGSGNPGTTNILRYGGKKAALITLGFDIFKGALAVLLAKLLSIGMVTYVTLAVFLGHLYPIFFQFRGGKGVATAFGALLILAWPVSLAVLITWLIMVVIFRYSSLAAITAALLTPAYMFCMIPQYTVMAFIISAILIWRHRSNIHKLFIGKESKI
ncbi:MAG: glycerol-3-phosphate 1-O-acyltransferase PlsY [Thiomargarita sp.]|nr:glycerol-3-phosphate 1-O-acyltransferase PlsY [Thiomargarita sp.]